MKKAQGLSLNVIIVAVIALVILVVLILTFTGKFRVFGKTTEACSAKGSGAYCKDTCPSGFLSDRNTDCKKKDKDKLCCIPFMDEPKKK